MRQQLILWSFREAKKTIFYIKRFFIDAALSGPTIACQLNLKVFGISHTNQQLVRKNILFKFDL